MHEFAKQQKDITWKPNEENSHSLASTLVRIGIKTILKYFHWFSFHSNIFCVWWWRRHRLSTARRTSLAVNAIQRDSFLFTWLPNSIELTGLRRLSSPDHFDYPGLNRSRIECLIKSKTENIIKLNVHPLSTDNMETNFKNRKINEKRSIDNYPAMHTLRWKLRKCKRVLALWVSSSYANIIFIRISSSRASLVHAKHEICTLYANTSCYLLCTYAAHLNISSKEKDIRTRRVTRQIVIANLNTNLIYLFIYNSEIFVIKLYN